MTGLSCSPIVLMGASHGIRHQLVPLGVGHGDTSCILLPVLCKCNALHADQAKIEIMRRQDVIRRVIWSVPDVSSVFGTSGMYKDQSDLGDILLAVFDHLDMPPSLKDVAVGEDKLEVLVDRSILDIFVMNNPIPLEEGKVIEILQMVLSH